MQDNNRIRLCSGEWVYCNGNCSDCVWELKIVTNLKTEASKNESKEMDR